LRESGPKTAKPHIHYLNSVTNAVNKHCLLGADIGRDASERRIPAEKNALITTNGLDPLTLFTIHRAIVNS